MGETEGLVKVVFCDETGELLGAHLIGAEVTELFRDLRRTSDETTEEELLTVFHINLIRNDTSRLDT